MLDYNLEKRGEASLYEYVYQQIRDDIVAGRIAAGEHLPSKRAFASHLGISVITIENAYNQLLAEGYICSMPRRGYYACELPDAPVLPLTTGSIDRDTVSVGPSAHPKTNARSFRPHRHRAPLGYDAQLLTICVGRGA